MISLKSKLHFEDSHVFSPYDKIQAAMIFFTYARVDLKIVRRHSNTFSFYSVKPYALIDLLNIPLFKKLIMNETKTLITDGIHPAVRFWTYLTFDICSIIGSLFVLYYFLSIQAIRRALHNHIIIALLCTGLLKELTNVPWTLYRIQFGVPAGRTRGFYLCTFFFGYAVYSTQVMLVAWATLERHILVFHDKWLKTKRQRFHFHYLPIMVILIYCLTYYAVVTFGHFCTNQFVSYLAGGYIAPCAYGNIVLAVWELLVHHLIQTMIIIIFSIAMIVRVIRQKQRARQQITWRKHRRMIVQMLSISALYLTFNSPWAVTMFFMYSDLSKEKTRIYTIHALYFRDFIIFLYPFLCFGSCTELRQKFRKKFCFWRR